MVAFITPGGVSTRVPRSRGCWSFSGREGCRAPCAGLDSTRVWDPQQLYYVALFLPFSSLQAKRKKKKKVGTKQHNIIDTTEL